MRTFLSLFLTPFFYFNFGLILGIFHPLQVISYKLGGLRAHKRSIDFLSWSMLLNCRISGAFIKTNRIGVIPEGRPLIIVSNHQTLLDIFAIAWTFRKHNPRFAAKVQLGKGIPSVSYYLRIGGSALIDRDNPRQAIGELLKVGKYIQEHKVSICIYAEGTRNRDGIVRKFQSAGVATLIKSSPDALIVPFAIDGHAEFQKKKLLHVGQHITYTVFPPIDPAGRKAEDIVQEAEDLIRKQLNQHLES